MFEIPKCCMSCNFCSIHYQFDNSDRQNEMPDDGIIRLFESQITYTCQYDMYQNEEKVEWHNCCSQWKG